MKSGIILTCVVLALGISHAFAGPGWRGNSCGPGGCPVPTVQAVQAADRIIQAPQGDRWVADDNEAALFRNGVQIGSWSYTDAYWRDFDARTGVWGPKSLVPRTNPPERMQPVVKVTMLMPMAEEFTDIAQDDRIDLIDPKNMGVDMSKIADHQATYSGRKISCDKAIELIGKEVPDDSRKFRLVVIGTLTEQKEALAQFAMVEPDIKSRCNTWAVSADHWSLQDGVTGQMVFKTQGNPVVYFQAPDGKVLHRQDDGKDIPQAIRKAVKAYDAAKDPDLRKPAPLLPSGGPMNPVIPVGVALGAAALYFILKGK